ncbi:uncharacterized protein LOC122387140 isoform X2 [Amphibalanus amphitrite]|nr:uncharacterized protein LOC122387140 isoform X2 [Amphibalanus amphitrite]XP_043232983.1 uncharacterized protein LOC122387140 isoform X2 [Amphibalanus amphitrite]XP_043232984.1 uncharacterized protein LOC122387140 isoform X2 [Amphibalanus amphitrite]XP_043232985.1 uncharacterized protein LOC122387140 isoform X2 [Amphibalanus amphitrite]XP_043232988.1 uncharacterized protein LOC122387140 isoform X2 [Amphibalanus amphitrite]
MKSVRTYVVTRSPFPTSPSESGAAPVKILEMKGRVKVLGTPLKSQATPMKSQATPMKSQATPMKSQATPMRSRKTSLKSRKTSLNSRETSRKSWVTPLESQETHLESQAARWKSWETPQKSKVVKPVKEQHSPHNAVPSQSPTTEMVIMTDQRRNTVAPSTILRAKAARCAPPDVDPVAEALELIRADMLAQISSGADGASQPAPKEPVTICLSEAATQPCSPPSPLVHRSRSPSPLGDPGGRSIFPDDIEDYRLRVRRGGSGRSITDRFGELLQRQAAVDQLQRQLRQQTYEMCEEARRQEAAADAQRRGQYDRSVEPPAPLPPTTAADTLLVLREHGCCGPADMCLTPPDLPDALALIHRLRCEVLELRACSLRTAYEKNEVAAQLNKERAQLRRKFTSAQVDRLTGGKIRGVWAAEDVRRAIAARRVLSRRQYRYITDVLHVPLPSLKLRNKALKTSEETRQLYEQLVAEKTLAYRTKKGRTVRKAPTPSVAAAASPRRHQDCIIMVASDSSGSEGEEMDV